MTPSEITAWATAAVALGALYLQARRAPAERRKLGADIETSAASTIPDLIAEVNKLRDELESSRDQEDDCQARIRELRSQLAASAAELALSVRKAKGMERERIALMLLAKFTTQRSDSVIDVLDHVRCGIVLTTAGGGGTIEWCSKSICEVLGRSIGEIIGTQWRALVHPDDLEETEIVENAALGTSGEIRNRYRHADGRYIPLRWFFTVYEHGSALSVVWFERRKTDPR